MGVVRWIMLSTSVVSRNASLFAHVVLRSLMIKLSAPCKQRDIWSESVSGHPSIPAFGDSDAVSYQSFLQGFISPSGF